MGSRGDAGSTHLILRWAGSLVARFAARDALAADPPAPALADCWGKSRDLSDAYPLPLHLVDAAAIAGLLWDEYLPVGSRDRIVAGLGGRDPHWVRGYLMALAASHDLGKAAPGFQRKDRAAAPVPALKVPAGLVGSDKHAEVSGWALAAAGSPAGHVAANIVAGHHGQFPATVLSARETLCGGPAWTRMRARTVTAIWEAFAAHPSAADPVAAVHLAGLVVLADWLVSDTSFIAARQAAAPAIGDTDDSAWWRDAVAATAPAARSRLAAAGLVGGGWPDAARPGSGFEDLFGFAPRGVQQTLIEAFAAEPPTGPELLLVTVPTGDGKTEAALWAAHRMSVAAGARGLLMCLPTMATTDAMYARAQAFLRDLPGAGARPLTLVHGRADLNPEYRTTAGPDRAATLTTDPLAVASWLRGSRRGLLADWTVATIDHLLLAALAHKHLPLRHVGAASRRAVVVDEVHDADPYMLHLLRRALTWLGAAGVPVVLLSATVSGDMAAALVDAYRRGAHPAPSPSPQPVPITYPGLVRYRPDGDTITVAAAPPAARRELRWTVHPALDVGGEMAAQAARLAVELTDGGGAALVVLNTVAAAQAAHRHTHALLGAAGAAAEVLLLHSRITLAERQARTHRVIDALGKDPIGGRPDRIIVVATQVAEQSLDIDADALVTALAPLAQLLQRAGRTHRHPLPGRPAGLAAPAVHVLAPELDQAIISWPFYCPGGSAATLSATLDRVHGWAEGMTVPDDVQPGIDAVYNTSGREWSAMTTEEADGWLRQAAAGAADSGIAESRAIPAPLDLDPAVSLQPLTSPLNPDDVAATRLGGQGPLLLPLLPDGADGWLLADGGMLPDALGDRPGIEQVRRVLLQCVPGPAWAAGPPLPEWPGRPGLAGYAGDHRTAHVLALPLDQSGEGMIGRRRVGYDTEEGLWWTTATT